MKHLKIAGLCLVTMFAVSMALSGTASAAAPVWEQCSEGGSATKFTEHQCVKAEGAGKWQWNEVTGTEKVRIKGSVAIKDTKADLLGLEIECFEEERGVVGPGKTSRIESLIVSSPCRSLKGCENVEEIEAYNLPWQIEVSATESKVIQSLTGTGFGEPGLKFKCKVLGVSETDLCLADAGKPESLELVNRATGSTVLLVLATYQHLRKAKCSLGGAEAGETTGSVAISKENGWGLRVH